MRERHRDTIMKTEVVAFLSTPSYLITVTQGISNSQHKISKSKTSTHPAAIAPNPGLPSIEQQLEVVPAAQLPYARRRG